MTNGGSTNPPPGQKFVKEHLKAIFIVGAFLVIVLLLQPWHVFESDSDRPQLGFPAGGPAEFLYLDHARVAAYLAQIDGGTFASEQQDSKASRSQESRVSIKELGQFDAAQSKESSLTRVVTPTGAALYFELLYDLEHERVTSGGPPGLQEIGLGQFGPDVSQLEEGQFVRFRTHGLRPPVYLNPYLALRQSTTLHALFPRPRESDDPKVARGQLGNVHHFLKALGKHPRVIFAIAPIQSGATAGEGGSGSADHATPAQPTPAPVPASPPPPEGGLESAGPGAAALPTNPNERVEQRRKEFCHRLVDRHDHHHTEEENKVRQKPYYLLPLDARRLTRERSLIKNGGGDFTVVGKVVRIFPEHGDHHSPAYVDSPTRETWEGPLANAPRKLLCGTDHDCRALAHEKKAEKVKARPKTGQEIELSRCTDLQALREQTEIPTRGAVILPLAIYK